MKAFTPYLIILLILFPSVYGFEASIELRGTDSVTKLIFGAEGANSNVKSPPPPPSPPYIDVYFLEKEGKFHRLIKEEKDNISYYMIIDYNTDSKNEYLNISWNIKDIPLEYNVYLLDHFDKVDMRKNKKYNINAENETVLVLSLERKQEIIEQKKHNYIDDIVLIGLLILVIIILTIKNIRKKILKKRKN